MGCVEYCNHELKCHQKDDMTEIMNKMEAADGFIFISPNYFRMPTGLFKDYIDTGLVPRFPSLIAAVGAIAIAAQLWVTGMILERVRLNRNILLQTNYRVWLLNQK
jgi:multimeric flavodoxin WrbA